MMIPMSSIRSCIVMAAGVCAFSWDGAAQSVGTAGTITTVAGMAWRDGVPAAEASISSIGATVFDSAGNLYFSDPHFRRVGEIEASTGLLRLVAGNGSSEF